MTTSTLTSKNQTTIPKVVIEALGLSPSDQLVYEIEPDGRVLLSAKALTFAQIAGAFSRRPGVRSRSTGEIKAAIRREALKRHRRGTA